LNAPVGFVDANDVSYLGDFGIALASESSTAIAMPKEHSGVIYGNDCVVIGGPRKHCMKLAHNGAIDIYARSLEF